MGKADALAELLGGQTITPKEKRNMERLDQLIDRAFTVQSHHAGLVQVADLYAFIFRRYSEFRDFGMDEEWAGERKLIDGYVDLLRTRLLPKATRWPNKTGSKAAKWFNAIAPQSLLSLVD